ncbi:MAG: hypothetical protein HYU48_01015 [Candidatus Levybacteria bacterium]|nr:hypothetical protein [Candidatus Levybacteria bacterium]
MSKAKIILASYLLAIVFLFLYSFTQVDLGLTLTRWSVWQVVQKFFQHIGYFDRPLSTGIYVGIISLLFIFYFAFLALARKNLISKRQLWSAIIATAVLLTFSYNAFSYDLFNYIFDAKIVTYYNQNPYLHKALDYPGEPMLAFMHWTHRVYPYGPTWLLLTVPVSFVGSNVFLLTFFMFKAIASASFLGAAYFIGKILEKISPKREMLGIAFFALNPLVIIESLVSAHNDIAMLFFALGSFFLFLNSKYVRALILLIMSIGVKFATVFILPVILAHLFFSRQKKNISFETIVLITLILMVVAVVVVSIRTNFQPWYLLYVLPFAALLSNKYFIFIPSVIMSFVSLLIYVPYLYSGNWNPPIPAQLFWITTAGIALSVFSTLAFRFKSLLE